MYIRLYGEEPLTSRNKNIEDMDVAIGGVVEELKSTGHYDDTIIMFISDNGPREKTGNNEKSASYPLRKRKSLAKKVVIMKFLSLIKNYQAFLNFIEDAKEIFMREGPESLHFFTMGDFPH